MLVCDLDLKTTNNTTEQNDNQHSRMMSRCKDHKYDENTPYNNANYGTRVVLQDLVHVTDWLPTLLYAAGLGQDQLEKEG